MGTMVRRCAARKVIHVGLAPTEASTCKAEGTRPWRRAESRVGAPGQEVAAKSTGDFARRLG